MNYQTKKVRTRFAPSPTGKMHIGNLRTALYSFLIAKHFNGDFILRIEDTDKERFFEGALDIIYNTLNDTRLTYDEGPEKDGMVGPYTQSERNSKGIYIKYALELIKMNKAYYCFCNKDRINSLKEISEKKGEVYKYDKCCLNLSSETIRNNLDMNIPYVIRLNINRNEITTFNDEIFGSISVNNSELEDLILIKSDGYPTYNFANVIDDYLMGITHVVRGSEYLSSTPKYTNIYKGFGWPEPIYIHCPLITNEKKQKLSKREGHSSYNDLIAEGYLPNAIINYIALLGWSPNSNKEIFNLDELIEEFDYRRINKSPAIFDIPKFKWINNTYIKNMNIDSLVEISFNFIKKSESEFNLYKNLSYNKLKEILELNRNNLNNLKEIFEILPIYLSDRPHIDIKDESVADILKESETYIIVFKFNELFSENTNLAEIKDILLKLQEETNIKGKNLYIPIRIALTGQIHGPDLMKTISILDGKLIKDRLKATIHLIEDNFS